MIAAEAGSIYSVDELERLAPERGFTVVSRVETPMDETDFRQVIIREMKRKPDVLYVNIFGGQLDTFVRQLRTLGYSVPIVVQTGLSTVPDLTPYEGYWYVSDAYFPSAALEERLVQRTGHRNTLYAANFYDSVRAIVHAFSQQMKAGEPIPLAKTVVAKGGVFASFASIFPGYTIDEAGVFNYAPRYFRVTAGRAVESALDEIVRSPWGAQQHYSTR